MEVLTYGFNCLLTSTPALNGIALIHVEIRGGRKSCEEFNKMRECICRSRLASGVSGERRRAGAYRSGVAAACIRTRIALRSAPYQPLPPD